MGLYSGAASYVRYKILEDVPEKIKEVALRKLKEFSFREIDAMSLSEKSTGWVSVENMASTAFDDLHFVKEPYLAFSLRIDVRRLSGMTLKAVLLREELKHKKATGREVLKKKEKDDLREQVRQALIKKTLPTPAVYDVCWNFTSDTALFFSCSRSANEEFVQFFQRSFDLKLARLSPYDLAGHLFQTKKKSINFEYIAAGLSDG